MALSLILISLYKEWSLYCLPSPNTWLLQRAQNQCFVLNPFSSDEMVRALPLLGSPNGWKVRMAGEFFQVLFSRYWRGLDLFQASQVKKAFACLSVVGNNKEIKVVWVEPFCVEYGESLSEGGARLTVLSRVMEKFVVTPYFYLTIVVF